MNDFQNSPPQTDEEIHQLMQGFFQDAETTARCFGLYMRLREQGVPMQRSYEETMMSYIQNRKSDKNKE